MGAQSQILASLKSIFPESSWPWVIPALRHDDLIWITLADPNFFSKVSSNSVEPSGWSPHRLGLISLGLEDAENLDQAVHDEAQAALSRFLEAGTLSPDQQQDFKHAARIALAMYHCYTSGDWSEIKQAMDSPVAGNNGWLTPAAIAFGFIPDQLKFILDLLENNNSPMILPLVVHQVLCQPIPQNDAQSLLGGVLAAVSLRDAAELLTRLDLHRPELAMRLANDWLEKNPASPNSRTSLGLGDQLQHLMDDLLCAQILTLAGQAEKSEQRKAHSLQFLNDLQVEVANQLVGESLRDRNIEYALSQWTRTSSPPHHTPPAGLVVELLKTGRLEDSLSILPETDRNPQTPLRWLNNIYQALENDDLAQARLFGHQALKSLNEIYQQGEATCQKAFGSRRDMLKYTSELIDRLADLALYKEAFQAAQIAAEIKPDDPQVLLTLAKTARSAGEYSAAISAAQLATSLQPTYPEFRRQLAKSFEAADEWENALPERQAVLEHRFSQPDKPTWPTTEDMLAMANCALQAGFPEQAYEVCQKTIEQDPADGQIHAILGEALAALGEDNQAMEHFSLATQLAPHKAKPWLSLASAYQRTGQLEKTIETLRTASHAVPDDASIFFSLGKVHLAEESPSQALSAMQRAYQLVSEPQVMLTANKLKKSGPNQVELFARNREQLCEIAMAYGDILKQLGHQEQAHQVYENAYHAYPAYPGLAYTYAKSILDSGEQEAALAPLAIAVASNPPEPRPYIEYAQALLKTRENPQDAVQSLQKALDLLSEGDIYQTHDSEQLRDLALALLAKAQEAAGQLEPALQTYSQALESSITRDEEWKNDLAIGMGRVAIQLDQPEIAIAALRGSDQKEILDAEVAQILCAAYSAISLTQEALYAARSAVHLSPDDVDVLAWFAEQALSLGVPAEAIPALTSAAQLDPRRTELIIRLAQVQTRLGRREAARDAYLSALSSPYSTPEDLYLAAEGLSDIGEKGAAADCLERALELQPHPPLNLIIELSDAYISAEKIELAVKTIEKGIDLYTENALLHAYKAALYQKLGRPDAARSCLEHALILDPEDPVLHLQIAYALRDQHELNDAMDHAFMAVNNLTSPLHQQAAIGLAAELSRATLKEDQLQQLLSKRSDIQEDPDRSESAPLIQFSLLDFYCIQAESALELEEQIAAAGALNEAYQLDPGHPRILALQSRMALRQGDRRAAQETFDTILQSDKNTNQENKQQDLSSGTLFGIVLAAIDLYQWDQAEEYLKQAISIFPEDSNLHLQRAKLFVLRAEFQRLCHALEITRHAPGDAALSPRSQRLFEEAIQNTINSLSQDMQAQLPLAIERWRNRGNAAFNPATLDGQNLDVLPEYPADQAALITAVAYRGDLSAVSRLYHAFKSQAGKELLHHSILAAYALALILNGQDQLSSKQAQEAVQSAIDQNPSEAIYYVIQAKAAEQELNWAIALSAMQNALSLWSEESRWHSYYGRILLANDQFPEAVAHYISAVEMEPEYLQNYLDLSQAYLRIGEPDQAIAILQDAASKAPDQVEPYLALASVNYEMQNYTQAARNADLAHRIAPQQVSPLLLRSRIAIKLDDPEAAKEKIDAALRQQPENPEALHLQAQTLAYLGETEQAIQVIDKAITLAADPLPLYIHKAAMLSTQEGPNDLLTELKSIAENYPDEPLVLAPLAQAHAEAGEVPEAIQNAQKALQRNEGQLPMDEQVRLHLLLGKLLRQTGQLDQSIYHLSDAIRIAPQSLDSYLELGITQAERRQHDAALETYKKAISIYPGDPRPYYQASLLLKASRDYPAAESMLRKAAEKAPGDVNIHRQLAALVALNLVHNRQPATSEVNSV